MFVSGFNRGLREARHNPSIPLTVLRAKEEDSDGEDVIYGEDDMPLPKGTSLTAAGPSEAESELDTEDVGVLEPEGGDVEPQKGGVELGEGGAGPPGLEIVPFVGVGESGREGARPPVGTNVDNVNTDSVDSVRDNIDASVAEGDAPKHVSPLRTVFPPPILDD